MTVSLDVFDDLSPFIPNIDEAKATLIVADAIARATQVAPCIVEDAFPYAAAAKAVIRDAVIRRYSAGSGAVVSETETVGPFARGRTIDTREPSRGLFWPSEIAELQGLCGRYKTAQQAVLPQYAFPPAPSTVPVQASIAAPW